MNLIEMLSVTFAVIGQEASDLQIKAVAVDLKNYTPEALEIALTRCRKELRGRMTLADIIERIPGEHPGAEEAWAIVAPTLKNENISIAWTEPMAAAYGACYKLADDMVAARMTYKEVYQRAVAQARAAGKPPTWTASLGFLPDGRETAQEKAKSLNLLINQSYIAIAKTEQKQLTK